MCVKFEKKWKLASKISVHNLIELTHKIYALKQ